jgi:hypothetical protein
MTTTLAGLPSWVTNLLGARALADFREAIRVKESWELTTVILWEHPKGKAVMNRLVPGVLDAEGRPATRQTKCDAWRIYLDPTTRARKGQAR